MIKKTTIYIVVTLLCLNITAKAQENKAVDVTLKGIQIGQKVPDITLTNLHHYKDKNGKPATTANLSDFKGRLLILDFWATWCSPCVAMIPKMDSLQKTFGDKLQFLSVTYQTKKEVLPFLEKFEKQQGKQYDLPVVTSEKELHQLFPHVYLPHYVWIDGDSKVVAITGQAEVNEPLISSFLFNGKSIRQKKDQYISFDLKKSLRENLNNFDPKSAFTSTLTHYINGLTPIMDVSIDNLGSKKITVLNCPLLLLYDTALRDKFIMSKNRVIIETIDSNLITSRLKGAEYLKWLERGNGFCYELKVEPTLAKNIYELMRDDLRKLFPKYEAVMEARTKEAYVLRRTSQSEKMRTKGEAYSAIFNATGCKMVNTYLIQLINQLNMVYQQRSPYPIIDRTGFTEKVDIDLDANLSDMSSLNSALQKYGLAFEKSTEPIEMLIIRDTPVLKAKETKK